MKSAEAWVFNALSSHGYVRVCPSVARAIWGNAIVGHFLYLQEHSRKKGLFSIYFGVRHEGAHGFALQRWRDQTPSDLQDLVHFGAHDSFTSFSLGQFLDWPPPWTIDLGRFDAEHALESLSIGIGEKLVPVCKQIVDDLTMFRFLVGARGRKMTAANISAQASEIIYLGKRLGVSRDLVMSSVDLVLPLANLEDSTKIITERFLAESWECA